MTTNQQQPTPSPTKPLDILVIEDTPLHQESADDQFLNQHSNYAFTLAHNYEQAKQLLTSINKPFDIVLTDLMMPKGSRDTMSPKGMEYIFDQLPYGFPLALLAAKQNVPYIAIVTDINHHDHPMSACIDNLSSAYWSDQSAQSSLYKINNSVLGIFHAPFLENGAKDWMRVLNVLMNNSK